MQDPFGEAELLLEAVHSPPSKTDAERRSRVFLHHHDSEGHFREQEKLPFAMVNGITYTTFTLDRIQKKSVMEVTRPNEKSGTHAASVNSRMLGVITDEEGPCGTCFHKADMCRGHYGLIRLARPIYYPGTINYLCQVLNLFCHVCGHARFRRDEIGKVISAMPNDHFRWEKISQGVGISSRCIAVIGGVLCDAPPLKYLHLTKKTSSNTIRFGDNFCAAIDSLQHVRRFKPDWAPWVLGFAAGPEPNFQEDLALLISKFYVEAIPVPPRRTRPPNGPNPHYITSVLDTVTRKNIALQAAIAVNDQAEVQLRETELYNAVSDLASSSTSSRPQAQKGAAQRFLDRKEGAPRGPGLRKRNDWSARLVVEPGVLNRPDEISIPVTCKRMLTPRVRVAAYNITMLRDLQRKGMICNIMDGRRRVPQRLLTQFKLKVGMYVRRHMQVGDLLNIVRNPTLHAQGMLVFKVREFWNKLVAAVNEHVLLSYGGDHDGDTFTLFMINDMLARAEGLIINAFRYNLTSRVTGKAMMGPHYNGPIAFYMMMKKAFIAKHVRAACLAVLETGNPDLVTLPRRLAIHGVLPYSGRALFSALLPAAFTVDNGLLVVQDGVLLSGDITVETLRDGENAIIKDMLFQCGPRVTEEFIFRATLMADVFLKYNIVSVGRDDMFVEVKDDSGNAVIPGLISSLERRVEALYDRDMRKEDREHHVNMEIINFSNAVHQNVQKALEGSMMLELTRAKVSKMANNSSCINGVLGQQYVDEQRPEHAYIFGAPNGLQPSLISRGMVKSAFRDGLNPEEYVTHMRIARRSRIQQNGTSGPGELSANIERAVDNIVISHFRGAVLTNGTVVQYEYGGDGLSPMRSWLSFNDNFFRSPFNMHALGQHLLSETGASPSTQLGQQIIVDEMMLCHREASTFNNMIRNEDAATEAFSSNLSRNDSAQPVLLYCDYVEEIIDVIYANQQGCPQLGVGGSTGLPMFLHRVFVYPVTQSSGFQPLENLLGVFCGEYALAYVIWNWRNVWHAFRPRWSCDPRLSIVAAIISVAQTLARRQAATLIVPQLTPKYYIALFQPLGAYDRAAVRATTATEIPVILCPPLLPGHQRWMDACRRRLTPPAVVCGTPDEVEALRINMSHFIATSTALSRFAVLVFFEELGCYKSLPELFSEVEGELFKCLERHTIAGVYNLFKRYHPAAGPLFDTEIYVEITARTEAHTQFPNFRSDVEALFLKVFVHGECPALQVNESAVPYTDTERIVREVDRFTVDGQRLYVETIQLTTRFLQAAVYYLVRRQLRGMISLIRIAVDVYDHVLQTWCARLVHLYAFDYLQNSDTTQRSPHTSYTFEQAIYITLLRVFGDLTWEDGNHAYWEAIHALNFDR